MVAPRSRRRSRRSGSITLPGISDWAGSIADKGWFFVSDLAGVVAGLTTDVSYITIIAIGALVLTFFILWRTAFGLRLRSCGEAPYAAATLGVNVMKYKYIAVVVSGALAGFGGAFLAIVAAGIYREGQTGGRGYIGLAAMIFGNWRPGGLAAGALLFGYTDALQLRGGGAVHALLLLTALLLLGYGLWLLYRRSFLSGVIAVVIAIGVYYWYADHRRRRTAGRVHDAVRRDAARALAGLATTAHAGGRREAVPQGRGALAPCPNPRSTGRPSRAAAVEVMRRAYAPYSRFHVGVAGLVDDGRVVVGLQRRERGVRRRAVRRVRDGLDRCTPPVAVASWRCRAWTPTATRSCRAAAAASCCGRTAAPSASSCRRDGVLTHGRGAAAGVRRRGSRARDGGVPWVSSSPRSTSSSPSASGTSCPTPQIDWVVDAYTRGVVADEQMSSLAMAILLNGMNAREIARWTAAMIASGERMDFTSVGRPTADKHSTGGVGDKITLPLAPVVAACGAAVPQLSGRGLGHTGGTLDKLESIPGWRASLTNEEMLAVLRDVGAVICAAGDGLAPADKKLYALRDVTGTVEAIPLIASSIMSKKIAEGTGALVLDVKVGSGAFMKDAERARELATTMVALGQDAGVRTRALLTAMDTPLGLTAGNALEVRESVEVLAGGGPADVVELTVVLAREMLEPPA